MMSSDTNTPSFANMRQEQLPIPQHKLHGWTHFVGLYAAEHVAATEFVIGATFVALGANTMDIVVGLLIGNVLAILSWTLITAPIAVDTRLSLFTYLHKMGGDTMTNLYNWANVIIFTVISAAMLTVSSSAVRHLFNIPAQLDWYPNSLWFVVVVIAVGVVVVLVAMFGFSTLTDFSGVCAPWLFVMFTSGAMVMLPSLAQSVLERPNLTGWGDFLQIGNHTIWTGVNSKGKPGIDLLEVIGFAWAANTIVHFGLIDMAILRYAKRKSYGLCTSSGMLFGHYVAWISAGIMGAGAAVILKKTIAELDPGDVAFQALGASGYVIVIVAGWTTANANLYRAGLAAQAVFIKRLSRTQATLAVGVVTVVVACFPFVFSQMLPLLTYAGLIVVPVGAIVFAEHVIFPRIGLTRYWVTYRKLNHNTPAVISWVAGLVFGFGLNALNVIYFYYLFIPTWIFTIILYTLLARKYGAAEKYPEEEEAERKKNAAIEEYQAQQALSEGEPVEDHSVLSRVLRGIALASLVITLVLAARVMFWSPDVSAYEANRAIFYRYGFVCTIAYFVFAYWALRRRLALNK
jgi:purine-cytosine permease-like protein